MPTPGTQALALGVGRHSSTARGEVCVMELSSILGGERLTDRPRSVCPVIAAFLRGYIVGLDDRRRQTLRAYAAASLGTVADRSTEQARRACIRAHVRGPVGRVLARLWLREGAALGESGTSLFGRRMAGHVVRRDDDAQHARVLAMVDELIAIGPEPRVTSAA
jgi:hypothetical protein